MDKNKHNHANIQNKGLKQDWVGCLTQDQYGINVYPALLSLPYHQISSHLHISGEKYSLITFSSSVLWFFGILLSEKKTPQASQMGTGFRRERKITHKIFLM